MMAQDLVMNFMLLSIIIGREVPIALACTVNQYKVIMANGDVKCFDCPKCPIGYGPLQECGRTIPLNMFRSKCQLCVAKFNYSSQDDFEQCSTCGICSEDQEMTQCTAQANTVCKSRCISKENYYEESSDDCQKCWWCCGDGKDEVKDECLSKGMPRQQSCTIHRRTECKAPVPTVLATTTKPTTVNKYSTETRRLSSTQFPTIITKPSGSSTPASVGPKSGNTNKTDSLLMTFIIIALVVSCFVILFCIYKVTTVLIRRINNRQQNQGLFAPCVRYQNRRYDEEQNRLNDENGNGPLGAGNGTIVNVEQASPDEPFIVNLPDEQTNENGNSPLDADHITVANDEQGCPSEPLIVNLPDSQTIGADIKLFEWFEMHHDEKEQVCGMLDSQTSFVKVARYFKMENWKVDKLKALPGNNPTADVMDFVEGLRPKLLASEFIVCTDIINRRDVSEFLKGAISRSSSSGQ